jgi:tetratricopeptide (TPR) repeat protein
LAFRLLRNHHFWAFCVLLILIVVGAVWARPHVRAWYHLRAARQDVQHYHNPQAISHLQICLSTWPSDPDVLLLAAQAARRARSYSEAEGLLKKYQEVRGLDDAGTFEQLLLSAERRVDQVAVQCWHYVEQGHPGESLILEALTRGYLRQYRLPDARRCLDYWLKTDPDNAQAHCLEGLFHLDYEHAGPAAEASYRRALELDPEHDEARTGLAVHLIDQKQYPEAAEHLERLRRSQPDNLSVPVGLAECYDAMGDRAEAVRLVDGVLARQPQHPPALALRGRLAVEEGQYVQAEAWLREALQYNPMDHRARYSLVLCLQNNGKDEEAQREQHDLQQREDDLVRFNEIVTKELLERPLDPALHCTLGQLLLRGGQREEGIRWLQSALRLDPQYAPASQALAEYQQKAKTAQQPPAAGP